MNTVPLTLQSNTEFVLNCQKNDGFNGIHANGAIVTLVVSVNYAFDICGQDDICSRVVVKV